MMDLLTFFNRIGAELDTHLFSVTNIGGEQAALLEIANAGGLMDYTKLIGNLQRAKYDAIAIADKMTNETNIANRNTTGSGGKPAGTTQT